MRSRGDFKSQIISMQKLRKRRPGAKRDRSRVDLMELHRSFAVTKRQRRPTRHTWIRGLFFALMATVGFFLLGYVIAALSVPPWAKLLFFSLIAVLGVISSYIVAASFGSR